MNKVILIGRLTRDPEIKTTDTTKIAKYTLAVDRKTTNKEADFISCIAFGKSADFVEKYLKQGTKIAIEGRIQTGSYTDREGKKHYTTDVVIESHEFVETRNAQNESESVNANDSNMPFPE